MIKSALLSSAALVLASTVAFAGTAHAPKGVIVTKSLHGHPVMGMVANHKATPPGHSSGRVGAGFGTFSDMPNAPYISWYAYILCGNGCGYPAHVAMAFTAPASEKVSAVDVGLAALYAGFYGYTGDVAIYDDAGGVPGNLVGKKASKVTAAATTWGPCCFTTQAPMKKVKIKSGQQYWVVVEPDSDSEFVWYLQDADYVNPMTAAFNYGSGWASQTTNTGFGGGAAFWVE